MVFSAWEQWLGGVSHTLRLKPQQARCIPLKKKCVLLTCFWSELAIIYHIQNNNCAMNANFIAPVKAACQIFFNCCLHLKSLSHTILCL